MSKRPIITINEERCTGCGDCIVSCAEEALAIVDGKAKLVRDIYCDGLGACIGTCPAGALSIIERDADDFDERAVHSMLAGNHTSETLKENAAHKPDDAMPCGCPSSLEMEFGRGRGREERRGSDGEINSELTHFPIKMKLVNPRVPFLSGRDLLIVADCAACAYPNLHRRFIAGRAVLLGCPKFDDHDDDLEKLVQIIKEARPTSITVVHMEVPCCFGYSRIVEEAARKSGVPVDRETYVISRTGEILEHATYLSEKSA